MDNKHYVTIDENNLVTDAFSDAFRIPQQDDICINENAPRHLVINGVTNAPIKDEQEFYLYKWNGSDIISATQAEQPELQAKIAYDEFKANRSNLVNQLTITTSANNTFDADEISQGRISRAVVGMDDVETIRWKLADNSEINATKAELLEALKLAGRAQEALWFS